MHAHRWLGLFLLGSGICANAQTACVSSALPEAAKAVIDVRHQLRAQSVGVSDPVVPPEIAAQLLQFKDKLTAAAEAAFACASSAATPEAVQKTLADALHANEASATESVIETRDKRDLGAYGSALSVQVFQLFGRPKFFEVDFRWGVECGDDNLLLVFETADDHATDGWHERLRWSAPAYANVGDALGDFVMLTPLTGSYKTPVWRFLVAHGHPGCASTPRTSKFDLDLLTPTADPAKPEVSWHFEHPYVQGNVAPRLATTEDTVDFEITHQPLAGAATKPVPPADVYRFHLTHDSQLEPATGTATEDSSSPAAKPSTTSSPQ